jgi:delta 1-pyrroline-5-carboxylate dehydrogenase
VVLKPSEQTPLTALALAELADRAGLPEGTFNVVMGDAPAIGEGGGGGAVRVAGGGSGWVGDGGRAGLRGAAGARSMW